LLGRSLKALGGVTDTEQAAFFIHDGIHPRYWSIAGRVSCEIPDPDTNRDPDPSALGSTCASNPPPCVAYDNMVVSLGRIRQPPVPPGKRSWAL
jgi:hypothetical protein